MCEYDIYLLNIYLFYSFAIIIIIKQYILMINGLTNIIIIINNNNQHIYTLVHYKQIQ